MAEVKVTQVEEVLRYVELQEPVWTTADRTRFVAKDSPDAAFAYGRAGQRIPLEQAERDGLVKSKADKKAKK